MAMGASRAVASKATRPRGAGAAAPELVEAFRALGDATRLTILELLKARGASCCDLVGSTEPGLCACDVERAIGLSQAATSHHLAILRRAGLIVAEKRGRWVYYRRNEAALSAVAQATARSV
jgi:DNA-binding transcriptional ArsR family regulator